MAAPPPPPALWAPQQEGVQQILQLLTEYRQPGANQQQVPCTLNPKRNSTPETDRSQRAPPPNIGEP